MPMAMKPWTLACAQANVIAEHTGDRVSGLSSIPDVPGGV
jgi:hypothetical protein